MKKVYEEFRQSRYWNDTLLIITYDGIENKTRNTKKIYKEILFFFLKYY